MGSKVFEEAGKRLVEPEVTPPEAGDEVTKPFVSELVSHDGSNEVLIVLVGMFRVVQQVCLSRIKEYFLRYCQICLK